MAEERDRNLEKLAASVADHEPVDWDGVESASAEAAHLRAIERIARAYRSARSGAEPSTETRFQWGHLEVRDPLGSGSYGTIFRAWDDTLQREVALKLFGNLSDGERSRFLDEARRLARVRHPNVLTVFGADVHADCAGIWTELVEGPTLAEWVQREGPLDSSEAGAAALELIRALGAIHEAGLIHGDVKAENVIRSPNGDLVLLDFGSAVEGPEAGDGPERMPESGTPLVAAPEVLRGNAPDPRADIYSLGTLLFRLLTGRYPYEADRLEDLLQQHEDASPVSLAELRPDLPPMMVQVVEKALSMNPEDRYPDASSMEAALTGSMRSALERRRRRRMVAGAVLAAASLAVALAWQLRGPGPLDVETTLFRSSNGQVTEIDDRDLVRPGDQLHLEIHTDRDSHVYILDEDQEGRVYLLFPVPGFQPANPLAGDTRHRLPGRWNTVSQDWLVTTTGGSETILVVCSEEPVASLEQELVGIPVPALGADPVYPRLDPAALEGLRAVGAFVESLPVEPTDGHRLEAIAEQLTTASGTRGVPWIRRYVLRNP